MKVTNLKQQPSIQGDQLADVIDIPLQKEKNEITSFENTLQPNEKSVNNLRRQSNSNGNNDGKDITVSKQSRQDQNTNNMQEIAGFEDKLPKSQANDIVSLAGSDTHQILKKDIAVESGMNRKPSVIKETSSLNNEKKVIVNIEEDIPKVGAEKNNQPNKEANDEVKENPVSEQNRGIVSWIAAGIVFVLTLFIAIFCTVTYFERKDLPLEYDYVIENWKNAPVISIRPSNVGCAEYLTEFEFPGTVDGCDCRASLSATYQNKIFPSSCSAEQLQNSCTAVNSTPTVTFTSWMINSQIFRLCVDRLKGFSYTDSDCKQPGFRICGVSTSSKTNMFCLPTTSSCPINSITFGTTAPDYTYTSIFNTGIGNIYVSSKQTNSQPLSFTRISTGSGVCNDFNSYHFFDSSVTPYELLRNKDSTCQSTETDPRFNNLFSLTETNLFTANNYLSTISALPAYPLAQNQNYFLVTRSYIPWQQDGDCRYTHMQRFIDLDPSIKTIKYIWIATMVVSWIVFIALGVAVNYARLKYNYYMKRWQVILMWLVIILLLGLIAAGFALSLILNNKISDMNDAQCSDLQTNRMIAAYRDDFFMKVFLSWIILLAAILLLLIVCLILLNIVFFKPKEKRSNEEEEKEKDHLGDDDLLLDEEDANNERNTRDGVSNSNKKRNSLGNDGSHGKGGYSNTYQIDGMNNNNHNDTTKGMTQNTLMRKNNPKRSSSNNINNENTNNNNKNNTNAGKSSNEPENTNNRNQNNTKTNASSSQLQNSVATSQPKLKNISLNKKQTTHIEMEVVQEAGQPAQATRSRKSIDAARDQFLLNRYAGGTKNGEDNGNSNKIQSLVQMEEVEDLEDHNDWEFNIDGYVKEHREARLASKSRIGGGYDIPKNKDKQPSYKFYPRNHRSQQLNSSNNNNNELDIFGENETTNNRNNLDSSLPYGEDTDNAAPLKQSQNVPGQDSTKKLEQ